MESDRSGGSEWHTIYVAAANIICFESWPRLALDPSGECEWHQIRVANYIWLGCLPSSLLQSILAKVSQDCLLIEILTFILPWVSWRYGDPVDGLSVLPIIMYCSINWSGALVSAIMSVVEGQKAAAFCDLCVHLWFIVPVQRCESRWICVAASCWMVLPICRIPQGGDRREHLLSSLFSLFVFTVWSVHSQCILQGLDTAKVDTA